MQSVMPEIIREQVRMDAYTTLHIGGTAEFFAVVQSIAALREVVGWARAKLAPITILGGGSNMLVSDEGIKGLVIKNEIRGSEYCVKEGGRVEYTVGAGVVWDEAVADSIAQELWGLENLSCIPGSVGATPIQNVGAYGVEVADRVCSITVYDTHADAVYTLQHDACMFGYRTSLFKQEAGRHLIVTAVTYTLSQTPAPQLHYRDLAVWSESREATNPPSLAEIRAAVCAIRSKKFPDWTVVGTAGSFFKNPIIPRAEYEALAARYPDLPGYPTDNGRVKVPLGWILDHILNVRGYRDGGVGLYEHQALVLVNYGEATAADVDQFALAIEKKVFDATGIHIEREVQTKK